MKEPHQVIRRPVVTEKGTALKEQNKYCFEVDRRANKVEVKRAVEVLFHVKVAAVHLKTRRWTNCLSRRWFLGLRYGRASFMRRSAGSGRNSGGEPPRPKDGLRSRGVGRSRGVRRGPAERGPGAIARRYGGMAASLTVRSQRIGASAFPRRCDEKPFVAPSLPRSRLEKSKSWRT